MIMTRDDLRKARENRERLCVKRKQEAIERVVRYTKKESRPVGTGKKGEGG